MTDPAVEYLKCNFCDKDQREVKRLVAGPSAHICDECIELAAEIVEEEAVKDRSRKARVSRTDRDRELWSMS